MGKSSGKQTVVQQFDPSTQRFLDETRGVARTAAQGALSGGPFTTGPLTQEQILREMDPFLNSVVGGVQGEFDRLRDLATRDVNAAAVGAGAFGGSRQGVALGSRLGELDRAQTSQISGLLSQGFGQATQLADLNRRLREQQLQEPLFRSQNALNFLNLGLGPVVPSSSQSGSGGSNRFGAATGGFTAGSTFGLPGALIGGALGGLFG